MGDARSRLSEAQRSFEATLAAIKATEGQTSESLDRARAAELRATEALRIADEERRRARRERDEAVRAAHAEAERVLAALRDEVDATATHAGARDPDGTEPRRGRGTGGRDRRRVCRTPTTGRPSPPRRPTNRGRGRSASVPAAVPAAGRAGSPRSIVAGSGRRSRPAGCG